jgi:hypothetical protein
MLISEKQQQANHQNAQKSTGPSTPEGRNAVRLNALTYGLRTRETILPLENPKEYSDLWDELDAEWQPQTRTERCYLETMVTSQWLLKRIAGSESRIYEAISIGDNQFRMLGYVAKQRAQLERSFRTAIADMRQSQKERRANQTHASQTEQAAKPASVPASRPPSAPLSQPTPPPVASPDYDYVMLERAESHPASCSPVSPDSR